jgi:3-oxoacyl-[acyl-carrier protein] reductase
VVTGAGRGIGRAIVLSFLKEGVKVYGVDRDEEPLLELKGEKGFLPVVLDVTSEKEVVEFRDRLKKEGGVQIVVHSAGITADALVEKMTLEDFRKVLKVNLYGSYLFTETLIPLMVENRYGRVVHFSSRAYLGNMGQINYATSKGGVVGLTRAQALRYASYGITVNAIAPGFINTRLTQAIPEEVRKKLISAIPVGFAGEPEDIAFVVRFLVDPRSRFLTGQTIFVCGGRSLREPLR